MSTSTQNTKVSRRAVARGAAWAAPTVLVAVAAPSIAASLRKDPGINGWVLNTPKLTDTYPARYTIEVNSNPSNPSATPDGAPYGLYLYDTEPTDVVTNAMITYWILGGPANLSWTESLPGHGTCWGTPTYVGTEVKPDGRTYSGYRWTYSTSSACGIDPSNTDTEGGVARVYLQHFRARTGTYTPPSNGGVTYWTQRHITINGVVYTFQRRNGQLGPYTGPQARMGRAAEAPVASDGGGEARPAASDGGGEDTSVSLTPAAS